MTASAAPLRWRSGDVRCVIRIGVGHVEAVHHAALELKELLSTLVVDTGRHTAAMERLRLLQEVERHLLQLIPEGQRWTYELCLPRE